MERAFDLFEIIMRRRCCQEEKHSIISIPDEMFFPQYCSTGAASF
jgi:hypothetical protein